MLRLRGGSRKALQWFLKDVNRGVRIYAGSHTDVVKERNRISKQKEEEGWTTVYFEKKKYMSLYRGEEEQETLDYHITGIPVHGQLLRGKVVHD